MKALEKAKLALRKHLMQNKQEVSSDLIAMRAKSEGNDIFEYVKTLSGAYSLSDLTVSKEITYDYSYENTTYYNLANESIGHSLYTPPPPDPMLDSNTKKDPEVSQGLFFC